MPSTKYMEMGERRIIPQSDRNREQDRNVKIAIQQGIEGKEAGHPPWMNPYAGMRAKAWKSGWDGKTKT